MKTSCTISINYKVLEVEVDGRKVKVVIEDEDTGEVFEGEARCNPNDNYNLVDGVIIAEARAVKELTNTRTDYVLLYYK